MGPQKKIFILIKVIREDFMCKTTTLWLMGQFQQVTVG